MTTSTLTRAAAARAAGMLERGCTPASRPSQRRNDERADAAAYVTAPLTGFELRAADGEGGSGLFTFEGMASVYEPSDHGQDGHVCRGYQMWDMFGPYTEYVHLGAGTASLANPQLDVPLVTDHRSLQRLARTGNVTSPLYLTEHNDGDTLGLHVLAPALSLDNPFYAQVHYGLTTQLLDEMSFRFMITGGSWSDDWTEYHIHGYDIHRGDVAIVGYGANPFTAGSGLRSSSRAAQRAADVDPRVAEREALHRLLDAAGVAR